MANQVSTVDVPLSIFGSLNKELSPPDLPEGASPDNNDVVYLPGSVQTRPGLSRVFSGGFPQQHGPVTYQKSFVTSSGVIKNLYLTRDSGNLWVEDVTNSPGVYTSLFSSAGATYATSCTAQGREYIALSDGVHGVDIPLQYDGANLYRLTQDGPGAAPTVSSVAFPSVAMVASGSIANGTIATAETTDAISVYEGPYVGYVTYYTTLTITLTAPTAAPVGTLVTISGSSVGALDVSGAILNVISTTVIKIPFYSSSHLLGTGGTAAFTSATTLQRVANTVLGSTATAHGLQPGFQVQVQGAGTTVIGGTISSIVLNNEETPGLATVTMSAAHGLLPGNQVNIAGVSGATVGTAITNVAFAGNFVTITTSAAHGLSIGSEVIVAAITNTTVNGKWVVYAVPTTTTFTYAFVSAVTAYTAADTGSVTYLWPLANVNPEQNFFTVQTAPSATTFTIALSYSDGTWSGGTVSFGWDGIFYVTGVPSTTSFQYQQYGPNATTTTVGSVTPYGQITPGLHQVRVSFLLADGTITPPSPPTSFVANGGQYASVTNLPIGPSNSVVGRVIQFTGSGGAYYFYLAVPAQVNGLTVSTASQINDNTSSSALLDFSDNTLYAATAVSIPGNDLAALTVLQPQAGMFTYGGRLVTWGGSNVVQNFLNMGFDGGSLASSPTLPLGWTYTPGTGTGAVVNFGTRGEVWQIISDGSPANHCGVIYQPAFLDAYQTPILTGNTQYTFRAFINYVGNPTGSNGNLVCVISSPSAGTLATATLAIPTPRDTNSHNAFFTANFSAKTPVAIPADTIITVYGVGNTTGNTFVNEILVDDMALIYTDQPYLDNVAKISYADNLGSFDQNTGVLGAVDDQSPIRNFGTRYGTLYMVTGSGLHQTADNGQTEPSNWDIEQVADNCGAFSIASVARNPQGIGSAGKDWLMWNGPDGAQIFTGQKPFKISQELQLLWDALPAATAYQCWTKNYESSKRCYFGIPTAGGSMQVLVLDYRNIDGGNIAENPPIHISFTGKMIVSDLTRKWTVWTIPAYSGELLYRNTVAPPQIAFGCLVTTQPSFNFGNSYLLNSAQFSDDDFGIIPASYTTYFFVGHEQEQALQVGSHRHVYTMSAAYISGVGNWTLTPYAASLSNAFPTSLAFPLASDPLFDMDFGINVETTRCAFKVQAVPTSGTDSFFKLQKLVINLAPSPWAKVRGSSGGSF